MRYDILNSGETLIWATPKNGQIELEFTQSNWRIVLSIEELNFFILGRLIIDTPDGKSHDYSEFSSEWKPDNMIIKELLNK